MSELRKCMYPGCDKQVVEKGYYFCGEHERDFKCYRETAGKFGGAAAGLVVAAFVAARNLKK
ncbi:hypothetical protein BKY29_07310 [Weissella confusa]|uniref:hypothetical protein n=1 Tax=Weissella confusa TaxID=1583 RepID=UPI0008FDFBCD|nr:hypothetical protein [Weissella confusa]OJF03301.1 hypothetical protein BKY29_07310 [Weissella confusa]